MNDGGGGQRGGGVVHASAPAGEHRLRSAVAAALLERKLLRLSLAQDFMDAAVVIGDIRGGDNPLTNPWLVGSLGLCSALVGVHDKWVSTKY